MLVVTPGEALRTKLQKGMPKETVYKRIAMIDEALSWQGGTLSMPIKHPLEPLPDGREVFFLKPGKEAGEGDKNPNDMLPVVCSPEIKPSFLDVWNDLSKIALVDYEAFRLTMVLVYRSAYLLDHHTNEEGKIRFAPSPDVTGQIWELERRVGHTLPFGLWGLLRFIDLLGWNEDVKYHSVEGKASFESGRYGGKPRIGRVNTLLTCVRIPYETASFLREFRSSAIEGRDIDLVPLYSMMQGLINTGGVCTPKQQDLVKWLSPYITEEGMVCISGHQLQSTL